jgi:perosamine synthetase
MLFKPEYNFVLDGLNSSYFKMMTKSFLTNSNDDIVQLKKWFQDGTRSNYSVEFDSGRMALFALLSALYKENGNVVIPGFSCIVVSNSVRAAGLNVRYADISKETLTPSIDDFHKQIDENTIAIVVQHVFGLIDGEIDLLKKKYPKIIIIEDCAHSLGSRFDDGSMVGSKGSYSFFSFEQSKSITSWSGGILLGKDEDIMHKVENIKCSLNNASFIKDIGIFLKIVTHYICYGKNRAWIGSYIIRVISKVFNFTPSMSKSERNGIFQPSEQLKLSKFKAAFLVKQLKNIDKNISHRKKLSNIYAKYLHPNFTILENKMILRYPIIVNNKKEFIKKGKSNNLIIGDWFSTVVHPIDPENSNTKYIAGSCPSGESLSKTMVNLPTSLKYTEIDIVNFIKKLT